MTILKERLDEEFSAAYGWNESIRGFIWKSMATAQKFFTEKQEQEAKETAETYKNDTATESEESRESYDSDSEEEIDLVDLVGV